MEAERGLKEHERMLEKNPSGKSMWSSTSSKYVYNTLKGLPYNWNIWRGK